MDHAGERDGYAVAVEMILHLEELRGCMYLGLINESMGNNSAERYVTRPPAKYITDRSI